MNTLIAAAVSLLTSFFKGDGTSKAAGLGNGMLFYGAIVYGVYWLLSDAAAAWAITLNARELAGVGLLLGVIGERLRHMTPPSV